MAALVRDDVPAAPRDLRKARLLLADEVGVGKTLSLAASAMISALLDDGPVLILCPSTLTLQWQVELTDKLGIPERGLVLDEEGLDRPQRPRHQERAARKTSRAAPSQIAIVSTGLIFHDSEERQHLLERKYGTVVLDEAHKARRRGGLGKQSEQPNNLLDFMLRIGPRTRTSCSERRRRSRPKSMSCGTCCAFSMPVRFRPRPGVVRALGRLGACTAHRQGRRDSRG